MSPAESTKGTSNRSVAIIATARTGTNYLIGLLKNGTDLSCGSEIFHPNQCFGLSATLIADLVALVPDNGQMPTTEQEHADLVRYNAVRVIDAIARDKVIDLFKIFPDQLPMVIVQNFILANRKLVKVVIDRNPIDTFISLEKALLMEQWQGTDTTKVKIELSTTRFFQWLKTNHYWYQQVESIRTRYSEDYIFLHYDEIQSKTADALVHDVTQALKRKGVEVGLESLDKQALLHKQDKDTRYESKTTNWPQFCESVERVNPALLQLPGFRDIEKAL